VSTTPKRSTDVARPVAAPRPTTPIVLVADPRTEKRSPIVVISRFATERNGRRLELRVEGVCSGAMTNVDLVDAVALEVGKRLGRDCYPVEPGRHIHPEGPRHRAQVLMDRRSASSDNRLVTFAASWKVDANAPVATTEERDEMRREAEQIVSDAKGADARRAQAAEHARDVERST
jgi:hypothetical protein